MTVLLIIYWVAGYWATGQTIYRNKIIIEFEPGTLFFRRLTYGFFLGWLLIPIALIRLFLG